MSRARRQIELPNTYVGGVPQGVDQLPQGYSGPLYEGFYMSERMNLLVAEAPLVIKAAKDSAESECLGKLPQLAQQIEADVQIVKQAMGDPPVLASAVLKQDILARSLLIERKLNDLNFQHGVANRFFGSTPMGKTPVDYAYAAHRLVLSGDLGASGLDEALVDSFRGAYRVQLHEAEVQMLQGQIADLHQQVAHAEALERAHEEALRVHEEALKRAHEVALIAHQEALRKAHEEALKKAHEEALARAHKAAQAQARVREAIARGVRERALAEKAIREASTYKVSGLAANPAIVMATGAAPVLEGGLALGTAIRTAIASISTASVEAVVAPFLAGTFALLYSPKLGNGELQENYLLSTPLTDLKVTLDAPAQAAAIERGSIDLPVRMGDKREAVGPTELFAMRADGVVIPSTVPVLAARHDAQSGQYVVTTDDVPPRNLVWTPAVEPTDSSTTLPVTRPPKKVLAGPKLEPLEGRLDTYPDLPDVGFDDYVIIFPADSGLAPLYVMFKSRRHITGVGVGKGKQFSGELLVEGNRNGSPIPSQIASKLRGRSHSSWNIYRQRLWRFVAKSPLFVGQFSDSDRVLMLRGLAPYAPPDEQVGGRVKYEIHHVKSIRDGGGVYDSDNIIIISPIFHIDLHR